MINKVRISTHKLVLRSQKKGDYSLYVKDLKNNVKKDKNFFMTILKLSNLDQRALIARVKRRTA